MSLARVDLQTLGWLGSCQVQTLVELAFPGYNSIVVATWLDPPCKLTQPLESDTCEGLEVALHVRHVLEWLLFFDSPPFLLALPKIFKEPKSSTSSTPPPCGRGNCSGRRTQGCGPGLSSTLHSCSE